MGGGGAVLTYGPYGGRFVPETLIPALEELEAGWRAARADEAFAAELDRLGPDNVRAAIDVVDPWAVDAASRLEAEPGVKDHDKVRAFVAAAR